MNDKIALLGTGLMGGPMGQRLLDAGFQLTVWNRSPHKTDTLRQSGARVANTPAQAVAGSDFVLTMLANGPAVSDVLQAGGVAQAMPAGALFIDMSSIPPDTAREHAALLAERGIAALDAPVSGGVVGAAAGTLAIMAGGSPEAFTRARPVFAALGRATRVGPAGAGALAKLANQMIVGITIGAVAEALLLAEAGGADPAAVREAIRGGFAESRVLELHGARMLARDFEPGAHSSTQLKDMASALRAAEAAGLQLPLTRNVHELYSRFIQSGGASLDHSALLLALEQLNARNSS
ncbi:MAG: NAD(P)-dependent oxidoreductase [Betaproteobacteria bacterium]|nr:NAD(P)-dependent oxidoreductase [Betaproteobacteria bacterium]